jgi:copper resistance protein C
MSISSFEQKWIWIGQSLKVMVFLSSLFLLSQSQPAWPHALPTRAEPGAGAACEIPPLRVHIWFDDPLEPGLCSLRVHDGSGKPVDKKDCRVNPSNPKLLEVSLPPLPPGVYRVVWSVSSSDGHRTQGDYNFTIRGRD